MWDSNGTVPKFSNLRESPKEWGIKKYLHFQRRPNLQAHNFRIYVNDTYYFNSKLEPVKPYDWLSKSILYENNRGTNPLPSGIDTDIRKVKLDYNKVPYFAQICSAYAATFLCGISLKNLEGDDNTPKQITSIARYHLCYTMKKFIMKPELMNGYNFEPMRQYLPIKIQSFNGESSGGGTYVKAGFVNYSNTDYLHFIPYDSNGLTTLGIKLLSESAESFIYSILGAQAKTRWSTVSGGSGKALQTQANSGHLDK